MSLSNRVNSENEKASETASLLLALENDFHKGAIDKDEYLEILKDIQNTIEIEKGTLSIEMKATLLKGISVLVKVV
jgi:hypothetical protein